jgi:protein TonB
VLAAALLTLGTYLLLPCMEMLSRGPSDALLVRSVDVTGLPPVPPPLPPETPLRETRPPEKILPRPRLRAPRTKLPVSLAMNLDLSLGGVGGDFDMDFGIRAPATLARIDDGIFELSELDEPPRPLVRIQPLYPVQARMRQVEGAVVLEFIVDAAGRPRDIEVFSATPGRVFADTAVQAVKRWRFTPGTREGKPVAVRVRQKITFKLED